MGQRNAGGKWDVSELYEKPQFSLRQVKMICERLLKEQEIRLRYEYECALSKKLEGSLLLLFVFLLTHFTHSLERSPICFFEKCKNCNNTIVSKNRCEV